MKPKYETIDDVFGSLALSVWHTAISSSVTSFIFGLGVMRLISGVTMGGWLMTLFGSIGILLMTIAVTNQANNIKGLGAEIEGAIDELRKR